MERRRWVAPYAGSLGSLFEGPLKGEALQRAPLELRKQAVKQAEGALVARVCGIIFLFYRDLS